jgi:FkbM family methyltransferase
MPRDQTDSLVDAVGRIWALVSANRSTVDDLFERMTQSFYSKVIRRGDAIIDGGAHTGRHTLPIARLVGEAGRVIAFEPLAAAASKLSVLLREARLDGRVQLRPEALASARGRQDFFVVNNMPEFSGLSSRQYVAFVPDQVRIQVDVETIDATVSDAIGTRALSFIKLDLEGGEFRALQGAERTLRAHGPCCVFENGLASSAADYSAEEFFDFFRRVGYELFDILGCEVHESCWPQTGPWYFVAMPSSRRRDLLPLLWASALEELMTSSWSPAQPLAPPPESFAAMPGSSPRGVVGCVDRLETLTRATGWSGDVAAGRPPRSIVVTVDGRPVATAYPSRPRYDVVTATGRPGFAECGFEFVLRTDPGGHVEVHAENDDGTFVKLQPASESSAGS